MDPSRAVEILKDAFKSSESQQVSLFLLDVTTDPKQGGVLCEIYEMITETRKGSFVIC